MQSCWLLEPAARPTFNTLVQILKSVMCDDYISPVGEENDEFFPENDYIDMNANKNARNDYLQLLA